MNTERTSDNKKHVFARSKPSLPSNDEIFSWCEDIVNITLKYPEYRRFGTPGDEAVSKYIADKLRSFGFDKVEEQYFDITVQHYESWKFTVDGEEFPCYFMNGAGYTDAKGVDGELVYVGDNFDPTKDYTNKIVVLDLKNQESIPLSMMPLIADYYYDPEGFFNEHNKMEGGVPTNFPVSYYQASKLGAVGFIAITKGFISESCKQFADPTFRVLTEIPGLFLNKYDGEKLVSKLQKGGSVKATIVLQGEDRKAKAPNVVATLEGQKESTIILNTHHDAGWAGGVQDASGCGALMAIAKYFASIPSNFRQKTLVFVWDSCHYDWNYPMGANRFIEMNPEVFENTVLTMAVEHIGQYAEETKEGFIPSGSVDTRVLFVPPNNYLMGIAKEAIVKNGMVRTVIPKKGALIFLGENQSFFLQDRPSISLIAGPKYLFTSEDTLDKIAKDQLQPVASAYIDIVDKVMYAPPSWLTRQDY